MSPADTAKRIAIRYLHLRLCFHRNSNSSSSSRSVGDIPREAQSSVRSHPRSSTSTSNPMSQQESRGISRRSGIGGCCRRRRSPVCGRGVVILRIRRLISHLRRRGDWQRLRQRGIDLRDCAVVPGAVEAHRDVHIDGLHLLYGLRDRLNGLLHRLRRQQERRLRGCRRVWQRLRRFNRRLEAAPQRVARRAPARPAHEEPPWPGPRAARIPAAAARAGASALRPAPARGEPAPASA